MFASDYKMDSDSLNDVMFLFYLFVCSGVDTVVVCFLLWGGGGGGVMP